MNHELAPTLFLSISLFLPIADAGAGNFESLPVEPAWPTAPPSDWLIDSHPFAARAYRTARNGKRLVLANGLVRRAFSLAPNGATVALDDLVMNRGVIRAVEPEALVTLRGHSFQVGGLTGQPNRAFLLPEWLDQLKSNPAAFRLTGWELLDVEPRMQWKRVRHHGPNVSWPPAGVHLRMDYQLPSDALSAIPSKPDSSVSGNTKGKAAKNVEKANAVADRKALGQMVVSIHYELYDGLPAFCKWMTVANRGEQTVILDQFTSERLSVVESSNWVETRDGVPLPRPNQLHVETDFAFGGFVAENANRHIVHWRSDPAYRTQVNYRREQPLLLEVAPSYGPAQEVAPGKEFTSCRAFELIYDSTDRERRSLALRRMYRVIAPWITENPLMMHLRNARDEQTVRAAIDQSAAVGFEMVILSFGSGFNIENENADYLAMWKRVADYARQKQVEIGGYSLLASRRVGGGNDVVSPPGQSPTFGNCPALTSKWGQDYFRKLYQFYETTGFRLLEHDGSYPGDLDITPRPPLQKGGPDSRWAQWRVISDFYKWCRGRGIYLNVPDFYYLSGSNKCGMGYRETNWSLPRAQQVVHTRQNIFDGTWSKTPSMGWMFVPLTQYHGGGAAATIEPLADHLEHYQQMLTSNLGFGVQACYRGPRLFDTDATRELVTNWVRWFKSHRDILESDVIHGRRADGRDVDWMLHVNPALDECGMLVVHNPLDHEVKTNLVVNVYYTGLTDHVTVQESSPSHTEVHSIDRRYNVVLPVTIGPKRMKSYVLTR